MPIQPSQIDALPTYSAAQQLKVWQKASVDLALAGVSSAINGRTLTRSDAEMVQRMIDYWQRLANLESGTAGGDVVLADFNSADRR